MELSNEQKVQAINEVIALYEKREWHPLNLCNAPFICIDLKKVLGCDYMDEQLLHLMPEIIYIRPKNTMNPKLGIGWFRYGSFSVRLKKLKELRAIIEENKTTL